MGLSLFDTMFHMELASLTEIWHIHVQKRRHLGAWMANIPLILIELVSFVGLLSVYLWKSNGLALKNNYALKVLFIAVIFHHYPHGTVV